MKTKLLSTTCLLFVAVALTSSFMKKAHPFFSSQAPTGYTGATTGQNCTNCHGGESLNSTGGSVSATGLPSSGYTAGAQYNFSITTTHSLANRFRWGFAVSAKNSAGNDVGSFSTTNPNAIVSGGEISHFNPPIQSSASASFVQTNLSWTAPSNPGPNDQVITFYYTGNAANGNGNSAGDFIYASTATSSLVLPVTFSSFNVMASGKSVAVKWRTENESNTDYFVIERSDDGQRFIEIGRKSAAGNSNSPRDYIFTDNATADLGSVTVFYRITTVDVDHKKTVSDVKRIALSGINSFVSTVVPNPVKPGGEVKFTIKSEKKQQINFSFVTSDKKVLKSSRLQVVPGANIYSYAIPAHWSDAVIYLSFKVDGKNQQIPLLIAR